MCLRPVPTHRYDSQGRLIYRPCGECVECSRSESISWFIRLYEEAKRHKYMLFVTYKFASHRLSYLPVNHENTPSFFALLKDYVSKHPSKSYNYNLSHPTVFNRYLHPWDFSDSVVFVPVFDKQDISKHFKRVRRAYEYRYGHDISLKYFIQGEYGPFTFRPHYHGAIFLDDDLAIVKDLIENDWKEKYGDVNSPDECITVKIINLSSRSDTQKTVEYISKYVCKPIDEQTPYVQAGFIPKPPRVLSKGIGIGYFDDLKKNNPTLFEEIRNVSSLDEFKNVWNKYFMYRFYSHRGLVLQFPLSRYFKEKMMPHVTYIKRRFQGLKTFVYDGVEYTFDIFSKSLSRLHLKVLKYGHEIPKSFVWRQVSSYCRLLDYSSKFIRYKDLHLRVLFEENFCRLLNFAQDRFSEIDPFEMDRLYQKYMSLEFKKRISRCRPVSYYSVTRAVYDELTPATLLAY